MPVSPIVMFVGMSVAFAAAAHRVHDKGRRVEAGGVTAHMLLDVQSGLERGPQIFHARHHVVKVNVVGMNVDVAQPAHEQLHRRRIVVHAVLQDGLAADGDAALGQPVHGVLRDAGDLVGMIEMRVDDHVLVQLATELDHAGQGVEPGAGRSESFAASTARALRRIPDAADVRHAQQALADQLDVLGLQVVGVAAADDDVLQFRPRSDVGESVFPALRAGRELQLFHRLGVTADGVAARAEAAIDRARIKRQEERLVRIAMRQARHRRVLLLVQRIEPQLGMIGHLLRGHRQKLRADRVADTARSNQSGSANKAKCAGPSARA